MTRNWTRSELLRALDLYISEPNCARNSPALIQLAKKTNRAIGSIYARLQNYKAVDPDYDGVGLKAGFKTCKPVWDEFALRLRQGEKLALLLAELESTGPYVPQKTQRARVDHVERASRAWPILVERASQQMRITYAELADAVGIHVRPVRYVLGPIQEYCLEHKLPPITILVVSNKGKHGEGFIAWSRQDLANGFEDVFSYPWPAISNPFRTPGASATSSEPSASWRSALHSLITSKWQVGDLFTLQEVYGLERSLFRLFPKNKNVKEKIRQTLQQLRDAGEVRFVDNLGLYELVQGDKRTRSSSVATTNLFPDQVREPGRYFEGATKRVTVNAYERSSTARKACLDHHGINCKVCGLCFGDAYGSLGEGFIHVHHLKPLASADLHYFVDPVRDLVPVCPNCHAMLHREMPPLTVQQLRRQLRRQ